MRFPCVVILACLTTSACVQVDSEIRNFLALDREEQIAMLAQYDVSEQVDVYLKVEAIPHGPSWIGPAIAPGGAALVPEMERRFFAGGDPEKEALAHLFLIMTRAGHYDLSHEDPDLLNQMTAAAEDMGYPYRDYAIQYFDETNRWDSRAP